MKNVQLVLLGFLTLSVFMTSSHAQTWVEDSYEDFADGRLDASGQNIYVSRSGSIRTIHRFDINQDGFIDLIFNSTHDSYAFIPPSVGTITKDRKIQRSELAVEGSRCVEIADLNRDGWLDLVIPQMFVDRSFILWGGVEGFSMERLQLLSVLNGTSASAADLTGNGYLDLILGGHRTPPTGPPESFVYIYWNGPDGLREDNRTLLPAKAARGFAIADFDKNGLLDIFTCSYDGGRGERDVDSYLYWNRPVRGFSATDVKRLFTHSAAGSIGADFNQDGWIDLAIANHKIWGDHIGHSAV